MKFISKLVGVALFMLINMAFAGTVTVSDGTNTITGTTNDSATVTANGDISIANLNVTSGCLGSACNPSAPPTASCTIQAASSSVVTGSSVTLTANCSNFTPTTYAWSVSSCTTKVCTDTPASTTTYSLTASDEATTATASKVITVTAAGTPGTVDCSNRPPLANATTPSSNFQVLTRINGIFYDQLPAGKVVPYLFKNTGALTSGHLDIIATGAFVKAWISQCPGEDYTNLPTPCKRIKGSTSVTLYISGNSTTTKRGTAACEVDPNQTYYLNVMDTSTSSGVGIQGSYSSD